MSKRALGWLVLAAALLGAIAMLLARDYLQHFSIDPQDQRALRPWLGLSGIAVAMMLAGVVMYPIAVVVFVGAAIYGPMVALATIPGSLLGAALGWYVGRRMGQDALKRYSGKLVKKLLTTVEKHAILSALFVRWIPGLPFTLQNAGLGAARVPFGPFMLGSILGLCVNQATMIAGGITAVEVVKQIQNTIILGWIGVALAAVIGLYLLVNAKSKNKESTT